jgi:hypothetical protein
MSQEDILWMAMNSGAPGPSRRRTGAERLRHGMIADLMENSSFFAPKNWA